MTDETEIQTNGDGKAFNTRSSDLIARHKTARRLLSRYNQTDPEEQDARSEILQELLGRCGTGVWIEPPFQCDFGDNIFLESGVFVNFNCVMLDGDAIEIGEGTLLGPAVQVYATSHPLRVEDRIFTHEGVLGYNTTASPVKIGKHVWIGGGAIILPGITIGDGTVVGAGSVVTKSLPSKVFAAGNPCRIIRDL